MVTGTELKKIFEKHKKTIMLCAFISEWIVLIAAYITALLFINKYIDGFLDQDLSAELVNGNILSQEGGIIAKDWFFSTELRVLNVPLVFAFFFQFFKSWHTVRLVSSAVLLLIMAAGALYCSYKLELGRIAPLVAAIFLLPFSPVYMLFVTCGLYYIPHISISLFTIGMIFSLLDAGKIKRIILLVIVCLLSFVAGIGGIRMIANLYLPLVLTVMIMYLAGYKLSEKNRFPVLGIVAGFVFSLIGFFVNGKLHSVYEFSDQPVKFTHLVSADIADRIVNPMLNCFGYSDTELDLWTLLRNSFCALSIVLMVISVVYHVKRQKESDVFQAIFFLSCVVISVVIFLFTETQFRDRYYLPVIYYAFLIIAGMFVKLDGRKFMIRWGVGSLYFILVILSSYNVYKIYKYLDNTKELREAEEFLLENGYYNGYASGAWGNQITELSNGNIEVWGWKQGDIDNQYDIDTVIPWLQKRSHVTERPEGSIFILLDSAEYDIIPFKDKLADRKVYENEGFFVFGFADYRECKNICEDNGE